MEQALSHGQQRLQPTFHPLMLAAQETAAVQNRLVEPWTLAAVVDSGLDHRAWILALTRMFEGTQCSASIFASAWELLRRLARVLLAESCACSFASTLAAAV